MVQTLFRSDLRSLSIHLIKLYKLAGYASQTHNNTKYYTHKTTFTMANPVNSTSDDFPLLFPETYTSHTVIKAVTGGELKSLSKEPNLDSTELLGL